MSKLKHILGSVVRVLGNPKLIILLWFLAFLLIWLRTSAPAAAVVLMFTLLYVVLAFAISRLTGRKLEIDIRGGTLVEKEAAITEILTIRNAGKLPLFLGEGTMQVVNRLTGEFRHEKVNFSLWPGQQKEYTMEIREDFCGKLDISLDEIRICDPLQLFGRRREHASADTGYVAPAIFHVEIPAEYLDSYDIESYQYSQFEKGSDTGEVFGLRSYQDGDNPKQIHWKLSAKMDEVVVKIPSYPIENNILLLLDNLLAQETELSAERKSKLMELFWSLSATLLEQGMPHSVGWFDSVGESFRLEPVRSREELWNTIPDSLSCGFMKSEFSTVYRYLEMLEDRGFSNHFYVTAQAERDIDRLESYGEVKVFREGE